LHGVSRELAEHSLHVRPDAKLIKQPLRRFIEEKRKAISKNYVENISDERAVDAFAFGLHRLDLIKELG
jgi:hypothetical protein